MGRKTVITKKYLLNIANPFYQIQHGSSVSVLLFFLFLNYKVNFKAVF